MCKISEGGFNILHNLTVEDLPQPSVAFPIIMFFVLVLDGSGWLLFTVLNYVSRRLVHLYLESARCQSALDRRENVRSSLKIVSPSCSHDSHSAASVYGDSCPICLAAFQTEDIIVTGSKACCRNAFHEACLSEWLLRNSTCPCCRSEIISQPEATLTLQAEDADFSRLGRAS